MKHSTVNIFRLSLVAVALVTGTLLSTATVDACPNCKETVADDDSAEANQMRQLGQGYSWSVLVMLGVPFALVAGFGSVAYFVVKKASLTGAVANVPSDADGHSDHQSDDSIDPPETDSLN